MNSKKLIQKIAYVCYNLILLSYKEFIMEDSEDAQNQNYFLNKGFDLCHMLYINYKEDTTELQIDNYIDAILEETKTLLKNSNNIITDSRDIDYIKNNLFTWFF